MEIRKILPYCFWKFLIVLALAVTCHGGSFAQYQQIPPPGEPNPPTMKEYMQHVMDSYAPQLENSTEVELANSDKSFKSFLKWRTANGASSSSRWDAFGLYTHETRLYNQPQKQL